jgi:hypothetical protein
MPLWRIGRQNLHHSGIVQWPAHKRITNHRRDVEIPDAHRIGIRPSTLGDLGGRPDTYSRDLTQQFTARLSGQGDRAFQPVRHRGRRQQRPTPRLVHPCPVPFPVRDRADRRRTRWHPQPVGARRLLPETPAQLAPGTPRLDTGDLLLQHRRYQHVPYPAGGAQAQARHPAPDLRDQRVMRHEGTVVVIGPEQRGQPIQRPCRSLPPSGGVHSAAVVPAHRQGRGTDRSGARAPRSPVGVDPHRGITPATAQRSEQRTEVERV